MENSEGLLDYLKISEDESKDFEKLMEVFQGIDKLLEERELVILAIDGHSGAGKSTFAKLLNSMYDSSLFHMDDYFLRPEQKTEERIKEIGGNIDYERFNEEIMKGIKSQEDFSYQLYDCQKLELDEVKNVSAKKLNIIEGCYSLHPTLIDNYDLKIFFETDYDDQINRIRERNGEFMLDKFINEWIPKENEYFEAMNIKEKSDIVLRLP